MGFSSQSNITTWMVIDHLNTLSIALGNSLITFFTRCHCSVLAFDFFANLRLQDLRSRTCHLGNIEDHNKFSSPADTGRKLNVHKTFRKCPRRLLNVLCTFNSRPVSMGDGQIN